MSALLVVIVGVSCFCAGFAAGTMLISRYVNRKVDEMIGGL